MKVSVETVTPVTRKVVITIPRAEVSRALNVAYQNIQGQVTMRGFRPGHVPRPILEARFGAQIEGEVRTKLISDSLDKTIEAQNLFVVSQPRVEPGRVAFGMDFEYTAEIEVKPEVVAQDYTGIAVTRQKSAVADAAIDRQLQQLREQNGNLVVIDEARALQVGDIAHIDYTMKIDGKEVDKGKPRNTQVPVRPDAFLPGFSDQMVGLNPGESKSFDLVMPADFSQQALAGKKISLNVTLVDIRHMKLPELDDDFAKDLQEESLEALKGKIRANLEGQLGQIDEVNARRQLAAVLIERNPVELPPGLVGQQIDLLVEEQRRQMGNRAPKGKIQLSDEARAEFGKEASFRLKAALILESIAKLENIEVSDEDLNAELAEIAKASRQSVAAIKGQYMKNGAIEDLKAKILEEKTMKFVMEKANVTVEEKQAETSSEEQAG